MNFIIDESKGEKLYKLIMIKFSHKRGMKVISKEDAAWKIHFQIYFYDLDPATSELVNQELEYKSIDDGITKPDFEQFISNEILSKLPEGIKIDIQDLSKFQTLKEQLSTGLEEGFLTLISQDTSKC